MNRNFLTKIQNYYTMYTNKILIVVGARQVGKTYIIDKFGKSNYEHYLKIDFFTNPSNKELFQNFKGYKDLLFRLSLKMGRKLVPNKTLIFFDEIQECPEIVTHLKYLAQNTPYDYIASGSLLGTRLKDITSLPVGYADILQMYPMSFEEFLLANGISKSIWIKVMAHFIEKSPIDEYVHNQLLELFYKYLIIGGMPDVVKTYLDTHNLTRIRMAQQAIIRLYKTDISKYKEKEKLLITEIFDILPSQLANKSKRFIMKSLSAYTKFNKYAGSFLWLANAGVTLPAFMVSEAKIPLLATKQASKFKLYLNDVGLLTCQYGSSMQAKILDQVAGVNLGTVYENAAAQELAAKGFDLYYYNTKKMGEVDFLLEKDMGVVPVEIKSGKNYYRHRAMDNLLAAHKDIKDAYVFCNSNISVEGRKTYAPIYCISFLESDNYINLDMVDLEEQNI